MLKRLVAATTLLLVIVPTFALAQVRVQGYTRRDGTYVQPHYRSAPDGMKSNNYSYPGNINPYTGHTAPGQVSPFGGGSLSGGSLGDSSLSRRSNR